MEIFLSPNEFQAVGVLGAVITNNFRECGNMILDGRVVGVGWGGLLSLESCDHCHF